jgi:hypothetical protein
MKAYLLSEQVYSWKAFKQSVLCFDRSGRKNYLGPGKLKAQIRFEINNDDNVWLVYFVTYFMQEAFLD